MAEKMLELQSILILTTSLFYKHLCIYDCVYCIAGNYQEEMFTKVLKFVSEKHYVYNFALYM